MPSRKLLISQKRLDKQVLKITKMVDDVIDLAKMESSEFKLDMTPVSISELARRLYLSFEPLFQQKNIRFELIKNNKNYVVAAGFGIPGKSTEQYYCKCFEIYR